LFELTPSNPSLFPLPLPLSLRYSSEFGWIRIKKKK